MEHARPGLLRKYVPPGERVVLWLHPSPWFIFLRSVWVIVVVMLLVLGVWYGASVIAVPVVVDFAAWIGAGILVLVVVWQFLEWLSRLYVLTDKRMISVAGVIRQSVTDVPLRNVRNLVIVRSLADRVLGLGTLGAATAGTGDYEVVWVELDDATEVMRVVRGEVDRVAGGSGEAGERAQPMVIGMTGGIGAGKSEVARVLAGLGFLVVDSDKDAKEALDRPEVRAQLVGWWGQRVLNVDGTVNRKGVAEIIFADPAERARLEAVVHPLVKSGRAELLERARRESRPGVVIDAPLLFEAGSDRECDFVIFADAPREVRVERVQRTRGWDEAELARREQAQLPLEEKRRRADVAVVNDSTPEVLRSRVEGALRGLEGRARRGTRGQASH